MTADRRSVSEQPPCKVCEGWGAYCDDHRPPVSGEPRTEAGRDFYNRMIYASSMLAYNEEVLESIKAIEAEASTGAALDVEALAEAVRRTALDHYAPEASASYARRLAKHYNTARLAEQEGGRR